jgi:GNAT superfamily N-acetyltransferase
MFRLRQAAREDIPILATHHRLMFEEILDERGGDRDSARLEEVAESYARKLKTQLLDGSCTVWVVEKGQKIVASGGVTIITTVPVPSDPSSQIAYIHSLYTDGPYRKQGLAYRIVKAVLSYCRSIGIRRVILNASHAGKPLYKKLGFEPADNAMRLWI